MKIRCLAHENNLRPCTQCSRAKASCITSSPKPLGRSKWPPSQTELNGGENALFVSAAQVSPIHEPSSSIADNPSASEATKVSPNSSISTDWFSHEEVDDAHFLDLGHDHGSTLEQLQIDQGPHSIQCYSQPTQTIGGQEHTDGLFPLEGSADYGILDTPVSSKSTSEDHSPGNGLECPDALDRVCCLNSNLLQFAKNRGNTSVIEDVSIDPSGEVWQQGKPAPPSNELSETLHNMSELLSIVQDVVSSKQSASKIDPRLEATSFHTEPTSILSGILSNFCATTYGPDYSPTTELSGASSTTRISSLIGYDVVLILNILSCYLQLIEKLLTIFKSLYSTLSDLPEQQSIVLMQTMPGVRLAGFNVQHGGLQLKILTQVVKHQLEMIESTLGLPAEYRVTRMTTSSLALPALAGFLGSRDTSMLLRVIMGLGEETGSSGTGVKLIMSLRDYMERVQ